MSSLVDRLTQALAGLDPPVEPRFSRGIEQAEIAKIEKLIGAEFPADVREFYRAADGQHARAPFVFLGYRMQSLSAVPSGWKFTNEELAAGTWVDWESKPDKGIQPVFMNPLWIPLTGDECGNHHCLDLDPGKGGRRGQVIEVFHDAPERILIAESFTVWIEALCDLIEDGECYFDEEYNSVLLRDA